MDTIFATRQQRLYTSVLGYGLLMGILATAFFALFLNKAALFLVSQLPVTLAAVLAGAFSWWWFILVSHRLTWLQGLITGLWSVPCALLFTWVLTLLGDALFGHDPVAATPLDILQASGVMWLLSAVSLFFSPLGWGLLLLGGSAGSLYALLVRRLVGVDEPPHLAGVVTPLPGIDQRPRRDGTRSRRPARVGGRGRAAPAGRPQRSA